MFLSINYGRNKGLFAVEENNDTYSVSGISETMTGATVTRKATLLVATINHSCLSSYSFTHSSPQEAKLATLEALKPEEQPLLPTATKGESQTKAVPGCNTNV